MKTIKLGGIAMIALVAASTAAAQNTNGQNFTHPCQGSPWWVETDATFSDFDFWVGEWQVYDAKSGDMRGFDDIKKDLEGCVIKQRWRQMDDNFTQPGLPWRLQGVSITGITADGEWRQTWADNNGGNLVFTGGLDEDGRMVLTSEWYRAPVGDGEWAQMRNFWYWEPQEDGTIKNWGYWQSPDENAERHQYFEITYRKSEVGSAAPRIRQPKD